MSEGDLTGRRVLEVGSGTGRFLAALGGRARAWGVDPAPEMLEVARGRAHAAGLKLGTAEELPFKDGWFERAVMWLVVHLLDRPRAFAELHRVLAPEGRLAIATFDPSYFGAFWLNDYFPSMEEADRARFPTGEELEAELPVAGFDAPRLVRLSQSGRLDRAEALNQSAATIGTFDLITEEEYAAGLERAERELEHLDYAVSGLSRSPSGRPSRVPTDPHPLTGPVRPRRSEVRTTRARRERRRPPQRKRSRRRRDQKALTRIAHEIVEGNPELSRVALVGIHTRGVPLAQRCAAGSASSRAPRSRSASSTSPSTATTSTCARARRPGIPSRSYARRRSTSRSRE